MLTTSVWTFDPDADHEVFANDLRAFTHPHPPYQCRPEFWDMYDDRDIPMPAVGPFAADAVDGYSQRLLDEVGLGSTQLTEAQIFAARRGYYGSVSYVDTLVGQVLEVLRETALDSKTVVVFTSDHGDMLGERGLWYKKAFYEPACRVPLMIRFTDRLRPSRVANNVSLLDLLPTFVDLASDGATSSLTELADLVAQQWDLDDLNTQVLRDRARRLLLRKLGSPMWHLDAANPANGRVLRNGNKYNE